VSEWYTYYMLLSQNDLRNLFIVRALNKYKNTQTDSAFTDVLKQLNANQKTSFSDLHFFIEDTKVPVKDFVAQVLDGAFAHANHLYANAIDSNVAESKAIPSNLHHELPFYNGTVVHGFGSNNSWVFTSRIIHSDREYEATKSEIIEFIQHHPEQPSILHNILLQHITHLAHPDKDLASLSLNTITDLENFLNEHTDSRLDLIIDTLRNLAEHYFAEELHGSEIASKRKTLLKKNKEKEIKCDISANKKPDIKLQTISVADAAQQLQITLETITNFAEEIKEEVFAKIFVESTKMLTGDMPLKTQPWGASDFTENAARLFWSAINADVFMGMGSWNDVQNIPDDKKEQYKIVSNNLTLAILDAVCAAMSKNAD